MKTPLALALLVLACASQQSTVRPAASSSPAAPPKTENPANLRFVAKAFSIPIPDGYAKVDDQAIAALEQIGGVALASERRLPLDDFFLASIVLAPIPSTAGVDLTDATQCQEIGAEAAKVIGEGKLDKAEVIRTPATGPTCAYEISGGQNPNRRARNVVQQREGRGWNITCNYDQRDPDAPAACDAVVQGFRFEQEEKP